MPREEALEGGGCAMPRIERQQFMQPGCPRSPVSQDEQRRGFERSIFRGLQTRRIVNNSEDDICRMFNDAFGSIGASNTVDLFPGRVAAEQEALSAEIYERPQPSRRRAVRH